MISCQERRDRTCLLSSVSSQELPSLHSIAEEGSVAWKNYTEIMSNLIQREASRKARNEPSYEERALVEKYLLSAQPLLSPPPPIPSTPSFYTTELSRNKTLLENQLYQQRSEFVAATNWTNASYDYCSRCLAYMGDMCSRHRLSPSIPWYKLREMGASPREPNLATFIYSLSHSPDDVHTCLEAITFHNTMFDINEKTVLMRIQAYIRSGQVEQAEQLLESLSDDPTVDTCKRLRTFMPILLYYCERPDHLHAVQRVYTAMQKAPGVYLEPETYCTLLHAGARHGWFSRENPALWTEWVQDLAEAHMEIDATCVALLEDGFRNGGLVETSRSNTAATFIGRVTINNDAKCPETGSKLRLLALSESKRKEGQQELFRMAASMRDEFTQKLSKKLNRTITDDIKGTQAAKELKRYTDWLRFRKGDAFSAFVDGANVAYFGRGSVDWTQVERVVNELERLGENALVIMPHKYVSATFRLSGSKVVQKLTKDDLAIVQELNSTGKLFTVPPGCFDDFYWMISSLAQQNTTRREHFLPHNKQGRFPGMRPLLISNDQMRDHRWSMLEPRLFRRWTSCHIVNYFVKPDTLSLIPARVFSREIQSNQAPKMGKNRTAWHFPVKEWTGPDRLCVVL